MASSNMATGWESSARGFCACWRTSLWQRQSQLTSCENASRTDPNEIIALAWHIYLWSCHQLWFKLCHTPNLLCQEPGSLSRLLEPAATTMLYFPLVLIESSRKSTGWCSTTLFDVLPLWLFLEGRKSPECQRLTSRESFTSFKKKAQMWSTSIWADVDTWNDPARCLNIFRSHQGLRYEMIKWAMSGRHPLKWTPTSILLIHTGAVFAAFHSRSLHLIVLSSPVPSKYTNTHASWLPDPNSTRAKWKPVVQPGPLGAQRSNHRGSRGTESGRRSSPVIQGDLENDW